MRVSSRYGAVGVIVLLPRLAQGECPDHAAVAAYVADVQAARVSKGFGNDLGVLDAECARGKLVRELPRVLGRRIGYKAAFTNEASRMRNRVAGPAWAVMFENMMLTSGARLPARFGAVPRFEADFVAVLKDAGLAAAQTPLEALRHVTDVVPFIELPDLMLEGTPTGTAFIATNIGFRGGVLGPRVKVEPTEAFLDSLANMTVVIVEEGNGKELGRAQGDLLMGHPIRSAMWLAQALEKDGMVLRPGDLLSLGGFVPPAPTRPGTSLTVKYIGLPGDPSVTVHFE